ncbi:hypothetical protein PoB_000257700 [Plakobranchus ocellatus]|uniref:Uncharacterized protein n=1 Tax=Plakobranchus ocellatus TaxID=259542 RepID=A0AAV3Y1R2_9GAST|nr:hypothetical protein PoB_000257700 [Plakobranchus ocellatus]
MRNFLQLYSRAPTHHGAQSMGHIAQNSSAVPGLPWSYTPSRGCETSIRIDPSLIQRKLTSQLCCPPVSGEGDGQGGMLMSDSSIA